MMKICKKIAALAGAVFMTVSSCMTVFAEEQAYNPKEDICFPSGNSLAALEDVLDDYDRIGSAGNPDTGKGREFASGAVAVFKSDEILYEHYFGLTDIAAHTAADENSVYEWGSISKTMIWVSVMQLWEQGKIDLNTDIRGYLPEGFFRRLSYDQPITMINLMNHNAGWQEADRKIWTTDENAVLPLKDALQAMEPEQVNPPGEVAAYSNYGAAVAAYVVECITGTDYAEYVHKHILEPLHMEHTAVNATHSDNAWVYEQRKKMHSYRISTILSTCIDLGTYEYYLGAYPCGANTGTMRDLITYAQALCDDAAPLFQNPETQKFMFSGSDFYGDSDIPICCHGFFPLEYSVRVLGHNGAMPFGQANMFFDLESKTGVITMCNEYNGNKFLNTPLSFVFGNLASDKYRPENAETTSLSGDYTTARGFRNGILKASTLLQSVRLDEDAEVIANNALQLNDGEGTALLGLRHYSDGTTGIAQTSSDFIPVRFYAVKLLLLIVYFLAAVCAFYLLRIRRLLRKNGKYQEFAGSALINISERFRIISVLATLLISTIALIDFYGIADWLRNCFCILQIISGIVCIISAAVSVISMLKTQKIQKIRHILNTLACCVTVCTIVYYQFWKF